MRHELQAFVADLPGYVCDKCYKKQPDRAPLASCRICDWDLCVDCANATAFHVTVFGATVYSLQACSTWRGCHVKVALEELTGLSAREQTLLLPDDRELGDYDVLADCHPASRCAMLRLQLPPLRDEPVLEQAAAPALDGSALDGAALKVPFTDDFREVLTRLGERSLRASPVVAVLHGLSQVAEAPRWNECTFLWGRFLEHLQRCLCSERPECPEALMTRLRRAAAKETATLVSVMCDLGMMKTTAFSVQLLSLIHI